MGPTLGLIILGTTLAVLFLASDGQAVAGIPADRIAHVGALAAIFVFVLLGSGLLRNQTLRDVINGIIFWGGLCLALVLGYALFSGERVDPAMLWSRLAEDSQRALPGEENAVEIRARGDHFIAEAQVDGASISMLVDTGATTVALSREDARRIGLDLEGLRYVIPVQTANGRTMAAPVMLEKIAIGPVAVEDVRAVVAQGDNLAFSLLGMSFLNKLVAYEVRQDRLVLRN